MRSPWTQVHPRQPGRDYIAFASSIPPRSRRSTWRLFRGSQAVRAQLRSTEGVVGFSMLARPLRKQYATLSLWDDEGALQRFAAATTHAELARNLAAGMGTTRFVRWTVGAGERRPSWRDALTRLERAAAQAT